ncbi:MAG: DUF4296 domain-containing protein [Paludibacteraceae bacterium]|nr:DUF4296 domain-containing protein [Paludibacteraceae bacterium]MBR5973426.1 DUF4296 domain-containing protein [Paludibacteraceae bacterium]
MKTLRLLLFLLLPLLSSCHYDKGRPIIPEKDMAQILSEYYLMQSTMSQFELPTNETRFLYYTQLLEKYGYSEADFDSSLLWYTKNRDVFEKVYIQATSILEAKKDSLNALLATQPEQPADPNATAIP